MEYFIGILMGYFNGTNSLVEKQAQRFAGCRYSNRAAGILSNSVD